MPNCCIKILNIALIFICHKNYETLLRKMDGTIELCFYFEKKKERGPKKKKYFGDKFWFLNKKRFTFLGLATSFVPIHFDLRDRERVCRWMGWWWLW